MQAQYSNRPPICLSRPRDLIIPEINTSSNELFFHDFHGNCIYDYFHLRQKGIYLFQMVGTRPLKKRTENVKRGTQSRQKMGKQFRCYINSCWRFFSPKLLSRRFFSRGFRLQGVHFSSVFYPPLSCHFFEKKKKETISSNAA